jgi:hypothetical protein
MSDYWLGLGTGINVAVLAMVSWDTLLDWLAPHIRLADQTEDDA